MNNKEQVFNNFVEMIKNSWTYNRMTETEKERCIHVLLDNRTQNDIKGTYIQRWKALNTVYNAFLMGLGYDGFLWRENGL